MECSKSEITFANSKEYDRGCELKAICDDKDKINALCKLGGGESCEIDCCDDKDLCNGGSAFVVSILLMVACALMTYLR